MAAGPNGTKVAARVWTPYKELQMVVEAAIHKKQPDAIHDLEVMLRKHKADFLSLLKTLPKNPVHRDAVKKSNTVGLPIYGEQRTQTFPDSFIEESLILSDLFDLNEYAALELLIAGDDNKPDFPGLTRGLVAVLLYYDGRRSLVVALRTLILSLEGRTWTLGLNRDLTNLTNTFVQQLVAENLTNKVLAVIKEMNTTRELDKLQNNRALGPPKHRKQVHDMYEEIQLTCAECLFSLACQRPLSKADTLQLISHLKVDDSLGPDGTLSLVTLNLLMALLYCFDVSVLEREDSEEITQEMPVFNDPTYIPDIHKELQDLGSSWKISGLKAVTQFAWGVMLRQLSQYPMAAASGDRVYEDDEIIIEFAISNQVFCFLAQSVVPMEKFHKEEFHLRRIHGMLTDFIYQMPLKVKEVRNRGDETARIILAHQQEGQEPPSNLKRDFEHLLDLIAQLYSKDPLNLDLALDYWCPPEPLTDSYHHRPPQKQVSLYKFVRLAGDLLPPSLYVPYINMLRGLASSSQGAQHCYNLLKMNGGSSSTVSWDHIFSSLNQYYTSLRRETASSGDMSHSYRSQLRTITPQELDGLIAVLQLTRCIISESEQCRLVICENQQWSVVMLLFGLITCSVPPKMKSELLLTLAAFARTAEIASTLWQTLESSQILVTVPPSAGSKQSGGIQVELDEIESRNEEYPMSRAFLELLNSLTDTPVPLALGMGARVPGFEPYLQFVMDVVFLRFNSRAYKDPAERWEVAALCLSILKKLLHQHEVKADDFVDQMVDGRAVAGNKDPGHTILLHMLKDSRLLQMILRILEDAMRHFEMYTNLPGQSKLEKSALLCLQMIENTLEKEDQFVAMVRETGSPILATPMDRLLLGINPKTGRSDYIVTIAKYLMFNNTLPEHALSATKILYLASKSAPIQSDLVTLFTEEKEICDQLLQGFVECLDADDAEEDAPVDLQDDKEEEISEGMVRNSTRQYLLKLMIYALDQQAPNLAHFLLGFEVRKPVNKTNLQDPGILNSPKTCLHSILKILSQGLGSSPGPLCLTDTPRLAELCFRLLYLVAANKDMSMPILRYLRTSHDFLYRHVQHLPYDQKQFKHSVANHQSWLLKTVAIELRVTTLNRQRSHTQRLMKLILDDYDEDQTSVLQIVGQGTDESDYLSYSRFGDQTTAQYSRNVRGRQYRRRIMSLLDCLDFHQQYPGQLHLKFFDPRLIQQVIATTERKDDDGVVFYDVKMLHRILRNELNNLQGTTMVGQRHMINEEIEMILKTVIDRNQVCRSLHSKHQAFEGWRQVTEIVLTSCPEDLLQGELRQTVLFEILQDLLMKVADETALVDLTAPVAGVILTLLANLRQCFISEDTETGDKDRRDSQYITLLDKTSGAGGQSVSWGQGTGSRTQFATSLQMVLKGLIEHIMRSSGGQQRVRAKLYGALLYYLQIAQKPKLSQAHLQEETSKGIESRLLAASDTEYDQLRRENISTILSYGDSFMDLVCRDACDGLDVGRMLALSVLDSILTMDKFHQWMMFLSSKGYLQHLVDSIGTDDEKLISVLRGNVENLKVLYLFESKMSFLTRVAETAEGAATLLRCGVMSKLALCTFFDMRPEIDRNQPVYQVEDEFLPDPISRYRHLLFAALKFCLAVLTSLGVENTEAGLQVMEFIVGHSDVFQSIMRDRQPELNLHSLQELALTTAVLARANSFDASNEFEEPDPSTIEFRGHRARIQRQMIALLPRYCLSEKLNKQLKNLDTKAESDNKNVKAEIVQAYLDVATNVTMYCRCIVSRSGPGAQYCHVLFGPNLEEATSRDLLSSDEFSLSSLSPSQAPNLGVVVYQLKHCANYFMTVFESRKQHLRKLEGLAELSTEDLKQFTTVSNTDKLSSQQRQLMAKKRLNQIIAANYHELISYSYIIENSLFLLWRHLEYYLIHCVPIDQRQSLYQSQSKRQHQIRRLQGPFVSTCLETQIVVFLMRRLSLFLLWRHLEYYLIHCVPIDQSKSLYQSQSKRQHQIDIVGVSSPKADRNVNQNDSSAHGLDLDTNRGVSQQDIDSLKQIAVSVLSESLFKKILEINQTFCRERSHYGFVEAIIRRIRRLLRLHTGS